MRGVSDCYNLEDILDVAKRRVPRVLFEYVAGGSEDGLALDRNRQAFDQILLKNKFLVDLSQVDLSAQILGERAEFPMAIAPAGAAGMLWQSGEVALARAASRLGVPFGLSMMSLTSMEEIRRQVEDVRLWFQLYMFRDTDINYDMVRRASAVGAEAIIVTIDHALGRNREHNDRNGITFPFRPNVRALASFLSRPEWFARVVLPSILGGKPLELANMPEEHRGMVYSPNMPPFPGRFDAMTWDEIGRLRDLWPRKLIIKSVLSADDARAAVAHGADAVVVSNHGGRAMDSAPAPMTVLPEIVREVGGQASIMLDGGITRGSQIAKALALGADCVLAGRAALYGVAAGGESGAEKALSILRDEFEKTLGYVGCPIAEDLNEDIIYRAEAR